MIITDPIVAATLAASGIENNPVIGAFDQGVNATVTATGGGAVVAPVANVTTDTTYDFFEGEPNLSGRVNVQFVFASPVSLNFIALAGHNIGTLGGIIKVQYSLNSGVSWIPSGAGTASPTSDDAVAFRFADVLADHWRIRVEGVGTNNVRIATVMLTNELVLPVRLYQGYAPPMTPTNVDLQSNVSEGGHPLGSSVVRRSSKATAALSPIPESFIRSLEWLAFQKAFNEGAKFYWGWRPEKYGDLFYAWRSGAPIVPENSGPRDFMSAEMSMRFFDEP